MGYPGKSGISDSAAIGSARRRIAEVPLQVTTRRSIHGAGLTRRMVGVGLVAGLLAGCTGGASIPGISGFGAKPEPVAETPAAVPGGIRVALILPLTAAGNVGAAGTSLKNAAEMAAAEFNNPK